MTITMRPYRGDMDFARVDALMRTAPVTTPHLFDFPWRFSSPMSQTGRDIYVETEDDRGLARAAYESVGFRVIHRFWKSGKNVQ